MPRTFTTIAARVLVCAGLEALAAGPAAGALLRVPTDVPTIQRAVDVAHPGDVIHVLPGTYVESIRIVGAKTGLTIEAADAFSPPLILGTSNHSNDGIRVEGVQGIVLRNLHIRGAYDGVRLNGVENAFLLGLVLEDHALGIRVNQGRNNVVIRCTVAGTRVEQGILVDGAPGTIVTQSVTRDTAREGIRVMNSPSVLLDHDQVSGARGGDGLGVVHSDGARVTGCTATGNYRDGVRVADSAGVTVSANTATGNREAGFRLEKSAPYRSIADVIAAGNHAIGNGPRDIVVVPPPCTSGSCMTTTTVVSTTSTLRATTSTTMPAQSLAPALWRMYVRIRTTTGGTASVELPRRSVDPPLLAAIASAHVAAFGAGERVSGARITALGGDTLGRLLTAAARFARDRPADYPNFGSVIELRWAERIAP